VGRHSSCTHIASPASRAAHPKDTQRGVLSTLPSAGAGDQDSTGGALHQLADLAFAVCNVQTVLRIMHSFAHALPDPQARGPPHSIYILPGHAAWD